jgi:hypothetical protein
MATEIQSDADKEWIDLQGGSASAQGVAMETYTQPTPSSLIPWYVAKAHPIGMCFPTA